MSMEFLIKHMGLDKMIAKLGLSTNFMAKGDHMPMNEKEISRIKEELKSSDYYHNSPDGGSPIEQSHNNIHMSDDE
jgi:hypothetical protein